MIFVILPKKEKLQKSLNIKNHSRAHQWVWGRCHLHKQSSLQMRYVGNTAFFFFLQTGSWRIKTTKTNIYIFCISMMRAGVKDLNINFFSSHFFFRDKTLWQNVYFLSWAWGLNEFRSQNIWAARNRNC